MKLSNAPSFAKEILVAAGIPDPTTEQIEQAGRVIVEQARRDADEVELRSDAFILSFDEDGWQYAYRDGDQFLPGSIEAETDPETAILEIASAIQRRRIERIEGDPSKAEAMFGCVEPFVATYRNYEGKIAERRIIPIEPFRASSKWHPEQWLLRAFDLDRGAIRDFALADFHPSQPVNWPEPKFVPIESGSKLNPERVQFAYRQIKQEFILGEIVQLIERFMDGTLEDIAVFRPIDENRTEERMLDALNLCRVAFSKVDEHQSVMARLELDAHDALRDARSSLDKLSLPLTPARRLEAADRVPVTEDDLMERNYVAFRDPRKEGPFYRGSWQRDFEDRRGKCYSVFVSLWQFDDRPITAQADAQFTVGSDATGDYCNVTHGMEGGLEAMEAFYSALWRRMNFGHYQIREEAA